MKIKIRILALILVAVLLMSVLCGCIHPDGYMGEHKDLYSQVMSTVLYVRGYHVEGELFYGSCVCPLESDNYGRRLFAYYEYNGSLSILVSQKTEGEYVYYYPDFSHLNIRIESDDELRAGELSYDAWVKLMISRYSYEEKLKERNDWNNPLVDAGIEKAKISGSADDHATESKLEFSDEQLISLFRAEAAKEGYSLDGAQIDVNCVNDRCAFRDSFGREIKIATVTLEKTEEKVKTTEQIMLFVLSDKNGSISPDVGAMITSDLYNYQEALYNFKKENGWNEAQ